MLPVKYCFIWPNDLKGEDTLKLTNQKQELPMVTMFLIDQNEMSTFNRGPSIDAFYQDLVHLAKQFQRRRFLEINQP